MLTAYRYKIGKIGRMFGGMQKLTAFFGILGFLIGTSAFNIAFDFLTFIDNKELGPSLGYTSHIRNLFKLSMRPFRTLIIKGRNSPLSSEMDLSVSHVPFMVYLCSFLF